MSLEEMKKDITAANADLRSYLENSEAYIKLKIFKIVMKVITSFAQLFILSAIVMLALIFLSFTAATLIGQAFNNNLYGFLIVGLFYVVVGVICYFLRDRLDKPFLRRFSEYYFDET